MLLKKYYARLLQGKQYTKNKIKLLHYNFIKYLVVTIQLLKLLVVEIEHIVMLTNCYLDYDYITFYRKTEHLQLFTKLAT